MKQQLINKTNELVRHCEELRQLWMEYVKERGEVPLEGGYLTMWDGYGERMQKLVYRDGKVYVVDVFGGEYDFSTDTGPETLIELHDVVFVANKSPSEE